MNRRFEEGAPIIILGRHFCSYYAHAGLAAVLIRYPLAPEESSRVDLEAWV